MTLTPIKVYNKVTLDLKTNNLKTPFKAISFCYILIHNLDKIAVR